MEAIKAPIPARTAWEIMYGENFISARAKLPLSRDIIMLFVKNDFSIAKLKCI